MFVFALPVVFYSAQDYLISAYKSIASKISRDIKIEFHVFHTLSMILLENGYIIDFRELATKSKLYKNDFVASISQKGIYFLELEPIFTTTN